MFKAIPKISKYKHFNLTLALMFTLCASVFLFPLTAYANEDGDSEYGGYTAEPGYYADDGYHINGGIYPIGIEAIFGTLDGALDISAIMDAVLSGELEFDPEWLTQDWFDTAWLDEGLIDLGLLGVDFLAGLPSAGASGHLTPDGTGTVIDNVFIEGNELEFFTFTTDAGNVFYLIIDRTRESNNVFFLNAVNEWSLLALAEAAGGTGAEAGGSHSVSGIPSPPGGTSTDPNAPTDEEADEPDAPAARGGINGTVIFILIAAVVFGGVAYYFKILRPKQLSAQDDDGDYDDTDDYDDEDDDYLSYSGASGSDSDHADADSCSDTEDED